MNSMAICFLHLRLQCSQSVDVKSIVSLMKKAILRFGLKLHFLLNAMAETPDRLLCPRLARF